MEKNVTLIPVLLLLIHGALSQAIQYRFDLSNIHHHELTIVADFPLVSGESFEVEMANTSPGRYAIHNFAKNVYDVKATDKSGNPLEVNRITPLKWRVETKNSFARVQYTLFANYADGTYAGIDSKRLHLNIPASFLTSIQLKERPIEVIFNLKDKPNWQVATQLERISDSVFRAPDRYYFMDSPILVGEMDRTTWTVDQQTIEVAMMHEGNKGAFNEYAKDIKKLVNEQKAVFGELPSFDFGKYTFLCSYNPWVKGDAMEHRNSTVCTYPSSLEESADRMIESVAHEFFHSWNMERLRSEMLHPFLFDRGNLSSELWFGEGFTNYYDELTLTRSGIQSPEMMTQKLNRTLNYVKNFPGRLIHTPIEMSHLATFTDAGVSNDPTNFGNIFISYYSYGEVLGYGLDLMLRTEKGKTLDEFMQLMWSKHGKPEIYYELKDLHNALEELTDRLFADLFFAKYVFDSQLPNYQKLLAKAGIELKLANPEGVDGGNIRLKNGKIESTVFKNTPIYQAGLEKGDVIQSINREEVNSTEDYENAIDKMEIGKTYIVKYLQTGEVKEGFFVATKDPRISLTYLPDEQLAPEVLKLREEWLSSKVPRQ